MKKKLTILFVMMLTLSMSISVIQAKGSSIKTLKVSVQDTRITLKWAKVKKASSYQIGYRRGKTWYSFFVNKKATSRTLTMARAKTRYYLHMRVFVNKQAGPWSAVKSVKTGNLVGQVTKLKAKPATYSVKLSWKSVISAKRYQILYKRSGARRYTTRLMTKRSSYTLSSLRSNSRYYVKMRAVDSKGRYGAYSKRLSFKTKKAKRTTRTAKAANSSIGASLLPDVTGINVTPGANASLNVSWSANSGTNAYYIKYRKQGSNGIWYQKKAEGTNPTATTLTSLDPTTTYEIRIKRYTYNDRRRSQWSDIKTATTYKLLDQAKITSVTVNGTRSMVMHYRQVPDADSYRVVIKKNNDTIVSKKVTDLSYTLNDLDLDTAYEVSVQACSDTYGEGAVSETRFTTISKEKMNSLMVDFIDSHLEGEKEASFSDDKLSSLTKKDQYLAKTVNIALKATHCSSTDTRSLYNDGKYFTFALKANSNDPDIYNLAKQKAIEAFFTAAYNKSEKSSDAEAFYEEHKDDVTKIVNEIDTLKNATNFKKAIADALTDRSMVKAIDVMKKIKTLRSENNQVELPTSYAMMANSIMNLGCIGDESTSALSHQYFLPITDKTKQCIARNSEDPVTAWKNSDDQKDSADEGNTIINRTFDPSLTVMSVGSTGYEDMSVFDGSNDTLLGDLKGSTVTVSEFEQAFNDYCSAHQADLIQNL